MGEVHFKRKEAAMPLKEALQLQAALAAAAGLGVLEWIDRFADDFRGLIETNEEFVRLVRSNPAAAQLVLSRIEGRRLENVLRPDRQLV